MLYDCIYFFCSHFKALTLDVIAQCAFAMDTDCQNNPDDLFLVHGRNYFDQMPSPERNVLMQLSCKCPTIQLAILKEEEKDVQSIEIKL